MLFVKIYNVQGAQVHRQSQKVNVNSDLKVDVPNVIELGTYMVEIKNENNILIRKLLI